MNVFDVFTEQELEELPVDDPSAAFVMFVRKMQSKLDQLVEEASHDRDNWSSLMDDERHSFMNIVIAAGKRYGIEVFQNYQVPRRTDFGDTVYGYFKTDLDHFMTQIAIDNSIKRNRNGVELPKATKEKIRSHVMRLRNVVDAIDDDKLKAKLHAGLDRFEKELDRKRLPLLELAVLMLALAEAPGGIAQSIETVRQLSNLITHEVAIAKAAEDEALRLPANDEQLRISPPREEHPAPLRKRKAASAPAFESSGADDDIPF